MEKNGLDRRQTRALRSAPNQKTRAIHRERRMRELPPEQQPTAEKVSFSAYELYLHGRYYWNRRPGEVVWQALRCFEQAVALEPRFAAAWAGIADIYATLGSWQNGGLEPAE